MPRFAQRLLVLSFVLAVPTAQAAYNITLVGSGGSVTLPPSPYTATSTVTLNGPGMFGAAAGGDMLMFTNTSTHGADAGNIAQASGPLNASSIGAVYLEAVGYIDLQSTLTGSNTLQLWANYGGSSAGTTYSANANCPGCAILLWNNISANAVDLRTGDPTHSSGIINQLGGSITTTNLTGFSGGDVTLTGANHIQSLAGFTSRGNFSLTNATALSTNNALNGSSVSLTSSGGGITLGGDVTAAGALQLGSTNAPINQTAGVVSVTGSSTVNAGNGAITLSNLNNFGGAVSATGSSVSIANSGPLSVGNITSASALALNASAVNVSGTLGFGNASTIGTTSGDYTQSSGATLALHATAASCDALVVGGSANLGGALAVSFSSAPANGVSFTVLTASAISGTFATTNVSGLGAGQTVQLVYTAHSVMLFVVAEYTVSAVANGHGAITPASQQVASGATANFVVTPDAGHEVLSVGGDTCSATQGGVNNWSSNAITADCAVTTTFVDMPSQCSGTSNFNVAFGDNFAGTSLDPARWTTHDHGGTIAVANNSVALSGSRFPYIASTGSPIPAAGPFSVRWIAMYAAQSANGTGSLALAAILPTDGSTNWSDVVDAWQDGAGYRVQTHTDANTIVNAYTQVPATSMRHDVEYCWLPNTIEVWVDGVVQLQTARVASLPRPSALWFGNPGATFVGPWNAFTLNYVEVRALNDEIFGNGFESP